MYVLYGNYIFEFFFKNVIGSCMLVKMNNLKWSLSDLGDLKVKKKYYGIVL